jgi:AmmeMemoRadiSam system protein A
MPLSPCADLRADEQVRLLVLARESILGGLQTGRALQVDLARLNDNLLIKSAVFITLMRRGELRGCIGSLQPVEPLAQAIANSAFNAAFHDRRFGKMQADEVDELMIEISVLSEMELIEVDSRQALLKQLQPGVDGLLLEDQGHRSTFLPKVWEKITSPEMFIEQLMLKAGLPAEHWSQRIQFWRYHTSTFAEN